VRRLAAAAGCLGLLLAAAALAPGLGPPPGQARAEGAECVWHRHSRRVVRHVRRHGRRRRVVRRRHWWSCDAVAPPAAPEADPPPQVEPEEPLPNRLGVRADEYYFVLSRPQVSAGEVTIELDNRGEDAHDLHLRRQGSGEEADVEIGETQSLQRATAKFDLPPGTYTLWCGMPGHREKGMETTLVVGGS
jgi:plastocyanin